MNQFLKLFERETWPRYIKVTTRFYQKYLMGHEEYISHNGSVLLYNTFRGVRIIIDDKMNANDFEPIYRNPIRAKELFQTTVLQQPAYIYF
jgi:hypothetical protein